MSSTCKVDDTALRKCTEGYEAFLEVVKAREAERIRRDRLLFEWSINDARWVRQHNEQLRLLEAGRTAASSEIWHGNQKYNCAGNVP